MSSGCDSLAFHRGEAGDPAAQSLDHLGFVVATVAEVESAYKWAQDNCIEIAYPLRRHRDGSVSFYIRDPDHNVIQVCDGGGYVRLREAVPGAVRKFPPDARACGRVDRDRHLSR
jgi:catechol 2,3-dioxygenase-like lactoylglutathione lyase family enzyme